MDNMISNAMSQFYKMSRKEPVIEVEDRNYMLEGYRPVLEPTIDLIGIHTLSGVLEYCAGNLDHEVGGPELFIHIDNYNRVLLLSESFGDFRQRHTLLCADAYTTGFAFGSQYDIESFIIALSSQFVETEDRQTLLELCGGITKETAGTITDTGITQKMEVKKGISMRESTIIKNPFVLKPFRTFSQIDQPESAFVFRLGENSAGEITAALHEADGSAWKIEAINNIKSFLQTKMGIMLDPESQIPVIA